MFDTPGFHRMTAAQYHADPAPLPSLSNSIAKIIVGQSPQHARQRHPRLCAQPVEETSRRLDLGSVAHALLLGEGKGIQVIGAEDYRTKEAKLQRDTARALGLIPVLTADHDLAQEMVSVARRAIVREAFAPLFLEKGGESEIVALWQERETWCRAMYDRTNMQTTMDYKTCPNASPAYVSRHLYANGYHVQEAWYRRGLDALDPDNRGRRQFYFLFQEIEPPFACTFFETDGAGRAMGDRLVERALTIWQDCMKHDRWPSYPQGVHRAEMPPWIETSILAQEERDFEQSKKMPHDLLMAG